MLLEVCANSAQSARNAQLGGAQRIELCQNLNEGGLTPSFAAIDYCINRLQINTFVLIRPRSGHFCYSDEEFYLMCQEVQQCKRMGVSGVAVGFLHRDLSVDIKKTEQIVDLAAPMQVTFHRAFDLCVQPQKALEDIIACGCRRLLTS
ncbi:MAG: copper homeostasis protein CutC, partial [Bacteroidales bacterium]|nr:copper homeostasis protein CutC [Bacteroidales bacterium]